MTQYTMTIEGQSVSTQRTIAVVNPATGEVFADAPDSSPEQLDHAMVSAQRAFATWKTDLAARRGAMNAAADVLDTHAETLGRIATMEQGMPLAMGIEAVRRSAASFRRYAAIELPRSVVQDDESAFIEVVRRPVGVVAAIKPWNMPINMATSAVAPALRAGCTVVLKPSPYTPLVTLRFGELLKDVLPAGVLNVISGADPLGRLMSEHPIPRAIAFTGSVATGKRVNEAAARDLKHVLLELGGNDAAIVLDDADPEAVADALFWRAFRNSGQICMAVKRVYVPEHMHDEIVAALAHKANTTTVGNGLDDGVELGPLNNLAQLERVKSLVTDAVTAGATVAAGGHERDGDGYFFEPTILTDVSEGMAIVDEEQFGPALPVMSYRSVDEAITRANATSFGLGASVWSADVTRAAKVAERLEAGTVWINTHATIGPLQPFGGIKSSGLGSGNGVWGVEAFTEIQTIYHATS